MTRGGTPGGQEGPAPGGQEAPALPFTVLLPVYAGDRGAFLRRAFDSATVDQTRRPDEVVIVRDGPVGPDLEAELAAITARSVVPVTVVALDRNVGLARALTAGLAACRTEVVARADADDISLPRRFEVQLPLIEAGLDLVGSALLEFEGDGDPGEDAALDASPEADPERDPAADPGGEPAADPGDRTMTAGRLRAMPLTGAEIARAARFRDPINHPSVVYRRSAVAAAGGYQDLYRMEDYLLFARMIHRGAAVGNVAEPLVRYRVGAGAYDRRGGWRMLRSELRLQGLLRRDGVTTRWQYLRNVVVRGGYRIVPVGLRRPAYRGWLMVKRTRMRRPAAARRVLEAGER